MLRHRFRYALTVLAAGAVDTGEELGDGRRGTVKREHQPAEGCRMGRFHVADTAVNHVSKPYNYIYICIYIYIYSKGISGQYPYIRIYIYIYI